MVTLPPMSAPVVPAWPPGGGVARRRAPARWRGAEPALRDLRRSRRRRRLGPDGRGEAAYRAYVTALVGLYVVGTAVTLVGDRPLTGDAARRFLERGPSWIGLGLAALVVLAVRSGRRGGPLAIEAGDVHHVLLSPHDRAAALAAPTARLLATALVVGAAAGALGGALVHQRLPAPTLWWWLAPSAVAGGAAGLGVAAVAVATAGRRPPPLLWVVGSWLLVAWAGWDVLGGPASPPAMLARFAFWSFRGGDPASVVAVAATVVLALVAWLAVGGLSVEAAARRTALLGQLRFAAVRQDVRAVVLLRRQLAAERHRNRPWFRVGYGAWGDRLPIVARDAQGLARWPAVRGLRVVALGAAAGGAAAGVWAGTTPLVVVSGVALYLAALDALEPLAQEVDHPSVRHGLPLDPGAVLVRHLVVPLAVLVATTALATAVALALRPDRQLAFVLAVLALPAAALAVAGGALSIASEPMLDPADEGLLPPEVAGLRLALRLLGPPAVTVVGQSPLYLARRLVDEGIDPGPDVARALVPLTVLALLVAAWVRYRAVVHDRVGAAMPGAT